MGGNAANLRSMNNEPVLLITGANGFVMSHVAHEWLGSRPEHRAVLVDRSPLDPVVEAYLGKLRDRIIFLQGSVLDPSLWDRIGREFTIAYAVHGAAVTSFRRFIERDDGGNDLGGALEGLEVNMMGALRVLVWASRQPALKRVIVVSTGSVYGDHGPTPLPEVGYVAPAGPYGTSKYAAELLTGLAVEDFGVPALLVRLSQVYGPLDRDTGVREVKCAPLVLAHKAVAGEKVSVAGLQGSDDFIYADDAAAGILALLTCRSPRFPVYNVSSGEGCTLEHLVDVLQSLRPDFKWEETTPEKAEVYLDPARTTGQWGAYDTSRLRTDTQWRPRSLETALADYLDWLQLHPY